MQRLIDSTCRLFAGLMVLCLALMVLMVFGNVVLRYAFNSGITVSEELSRWLFVWMTFLGALVALRQHAHLGTDSLTSRLPPAGRKACLALALGLMLFACVLLLRGGWQQFVINLGTTSAVMEASMGWLYASGVVFAALAIVLIAHELWRLLSGRLGADELIAVRESEDVPPAHAGAGAGAGSAER